eukprot:jgi/Mesvir1/22875/Mv25884-RA.1
MGLPLASQQHASASNRHARTSVPLIILVCICCALCLPCIEASTGICTDSQSGVTQDSGCDSIYPICVDLGPSDANNAQGNMCAVCLDTASGLGQDLGCPSYYPVCRVVGGGSPPYFLANTGSFGGGVVCGLCMDTAAGAGQDFNCPSTQPICFDMGPSDANIGSGLGCAECIDSERGLRPDTGCTDPDAPLCYTGGYNMGDFTFGTRCWAGNCHIVGPSEVAATCPTSMAVEASFTVHRTDCFENFIVQAFLDDVLNIFLQTGPLCKGQVAAHFDLVGRRRHLLQDPQDITLVLRIYVDDFPQGQQLLELLLSPEFIQFVFDWFSPGRFGEVLSVDSLHAAFLLLSSARSDPHFTTAQGHEFDFNGEVGKSYCIVTDESIHVNARFMGVAQSSDPMLVEDTLAAKPDNRTWMDQVAIMVGNDRVLVSAESPAGTSYSALVGTVLLNGEPFEGLSAIHNLPSGAVVSRKRNRVVITNPNVAVVEVEIVRAGFWEEGKGPGKNFVNLQVKEFKASKKAHGVLGQFFLDDNKEVLPVGSTADYLTSGIFAADCQFSRFVAEM